MRKIILLIICSILCRIDASAQDNSYNYYFRNISKNEGLSQTDIKAILQDKSGFMWFGTRNKLNRYDGNNIHVFDCYDKNKEIRNNNISSLFECNSGHIWVGTDNGIFIFEPIHETFTFIGDTTAEGVSMIDWVSDIKADKEGNVWITLPNQGLFRYNKEKPLKQYTFNNSGIHNYSSPHCIVIDQSDRLWIGTNGGGIYLYDKKSDKFTQFLGNSNGESLLNKGIYRMCDYGNELIIGIHEGKLYKYDKLRNILSVVNASEVHYKIIRDIACFGDEIWVGTNAGVYIINEKSNVVDHLYNDPMCTYSLSDNQIGRIYRDKEGGIWIGTNMGGINYLPQYNMKFHRHTPRSSKFSISSKRIREIIEDSNRNIWVGTDNDGINILNPQNGKFTQLRQNSEQGLSNDRTLALLNKGNEIWVGYFKEGIDIIDNQLKRQKHYTPKQLNINDGSIYALYEDCKGNLWIGSGWGVYIGNPEKMQEFKYQPQFGYNYIYDIKEDIDRNIWIATMGKGVFLYNPKDNTTKHFTHNIKDSTTLSSNSVSNITITSNGEVWLSTDRGGICRYNQDGTFTTISVKHGLPDDTAYKILEDKNNYLWFGTNNGLVKFNPKTYKCKVYTTNDGLSSNQFSYKSAHVSKSGIFYFGTSEGLISFDPYISQNNGYAPQIYITKLLINNEEITQDSPNSPISKSISHTSEITLKYSKSSIGFEFSALSYTHPKANLYAYKMEGFDEKWNYTRNVHAVSYTNLSPGKYTFKVRASNNNGVWNNDARSIEITILSPWWRHPLAWITYIFIILLSIYYMFVRYKRKSEVRAKGNLILIEHEKEKEIYRAKVDFFTHIAHEIRTPVTLINGPLEAMERMEIKDQQILKNIKIMRKSTAELLTLINQLLDFRKVESNKMQINLLPINIKELLSDISAQFLATMPNTKKLELIEPENNIYVSGDKNSLIKIFNNLFSNAVKYSDKYIEIKISISENKCNIIFANDGDLIPNEQCERIFDPFYQMKRNENQPSSSGIGLSLARSLSEMHKGNLVYQERNGMNCFILSLPINSIPVETTSREERKTNEETTNNENKQYNDTILVVEDNIELRDFMIDTLQQHFIIEQAPDGVVALEILKDKNIDLIISDIMMPRMDGFELCKQIKSDIEYSHIPIILLTAKNDLDSKVKGVKSGAEAYIEKPFSFEYLIVQINSIIENRKREKEAFMRKPTLFTQPSGISKADEELLNRIINVIEENITNPNFGVESLSETVCLSRSSLHRKIKALAGTSPTDFIRLVRLKKSVQFISEGSYRISEVCYLVGINSPSYFIKLFQKQFGITPKEFEKQVRQSNKNEEV